MPGRTGSKPSASFGPPSTSCFGFSGKIFSNSTLCLSICRFLGEVLREFLLGFDLLDFLGVFFLRLDLLDFLDVLLLGLDLLDFLLALDLFDLGFDVLLDLVCGHRSARGLQAEHSLVHLEGIAAFHELRLVLDEVLQILADGLLELGFRVLLELELLLDVLFEFVLVVFELVLVILRLDLEFLVVLEFGLLVLELELVLPLLLAERLVGELVDMLDRRSRGACALQAGVL